MIPNYNRYKTLLQQWIDLPSLDISLKKHLYRLFRFGKQYDKLYAVIPDKYLTSDTINLDLTSTTTKKLPGIQMVTILNSKGISLNDFDLKGKLYGNSEVLIFGKYKIEGNTLVKISQQQSEIDSIAKDLITKTKKLSVNLDKLKERIIG